MKVQEEKMKEKIKGRMIKDKKMKKETCVYNSHTGSGSQPFI
jgi:hypothetical protein